MQQGALVKSKPESIESRERPSAAPPVWRFADIADKASLSTLAARARAALPFRHYDQDIEWQSIGADPSDEMIALIDSDEAGLQGFLSVHAHAASIDLRLAGVPLLRRRVRRLEVYEHVATNRQDARGAIASALVALATRMPRNGVLFLEAVPLSSDLHAVLTSPDNPIRRTFHVLPWATSTVARMKWPGTLDEYLKSIGRGTRKDLKRNASDLLSDPVARCELRRFGATADVDRFIRDGIVISDKTYQKKLLSRGLSKGSKEESKIRFAAARRAFLGHILYSNDTPIAFQYGFVYAGTYFVDQVGYDPEWANRQVGAVLFHEALRDVEKAKLEIKTFDFGQGMTLFKERTANERHEVAHYYLFNRTTRGVILYQTAKAMIRLPQIVSRTLDRLRLRDGVRAIMRRWTGHGHMR